MADQVIKNCSTCQQWKQTITEAMNDFGFLQHALDKCSFLSYRAERDSDDAFLVWAADDGLHYVLDGIMGLQPPRAHCNRTHTVERRCHHR